jgi:FkbM family methyltransferase
MQPPASGALVYDVGMHNGDDTAYYLHKGWRVIAIEANPALIPAARQRFAAALAAGRLALVNVAIAATAGEVDLFVPAGRDLAGSLVESNAARFSGALQRLRVPCRPFAAIMADYGTPHYVKIDIEGSDRLCLDALTPGNLPPFVSIEMAHADGDADIRRLAALGYRGFKCVRQNDLAVIGPAELPRQLALRRRRARGGLSGLAVGATRRLERLLMPVRDGDWRFPKGASGPFGTSLAGAWLDAAAMLGVWQALHDIDAELGAGGVGEWFDVHAALAMD